MPININIILMPRLVGGINVLNINQYTGILAGILVLGLKLTVSLFFSVLIFSDIELYICHGGIYCTVNEMENIGKINLLSVSSSSSSSLI